MKNTTKKTSLYTALGLLMGLSGTAQAHFQMMIPADDMVSQDEAHSIHLDIKFWHPFEGHGMNMGQPKQAGMLVKGEQHDLLGQLKKATYTDVNGDKRQGFTLDVRMPRPGDYVFYIEPAPYWEPAEETFIVHYTKVVVNGFGMEAGWDQPVGLKTEIMPLTRPYGLYTGNVFQGQVLLDGKPVPNAEVEVEYYDEQHTLHAPADPMITQVVKADSNGVFTYAMPKAGWWGFAALNTSDKTMRHDGKDYPIELGALIWVKTHDMR